MPRPDMYSKACTAAGVVRLEAREQASAASGEGTAQSATSVSRGRGANFSTAAVMMPSVPSAPTNSWRRQ